MQNRVMRDSNVLTSSKTSLSEGTKPLPPFSPASLPLTSVVPMRRFVEASRRGSFATVSFFNRFAMSGGMGALIVMLLPEGGKSSLELYWLEFASLH